jgi:hypothetical protein
MRFLLKPLALSFCCAVGALALSLLFSAIYRTPHPAGFSLAFILGGVALLLSGVKSETRSTKISYPIFLLVFGLLGYGASLFL